MSDSKVKPNCQKLARLKWQCRRGMLELDVVLLPFLDNVYPQLESEAQEMFESLLTQSDPDLYAWIMGYEMPKPEFKGIVEHIRIFVDSQSLP